MGNIVVDHEGCKRTNSYIQLGTVECAWLIRNRNSAVFAFEVAQESALDR